MANTIRKQCDSKKSVFIRFDQPVKADMNGKETLAFPLAERLLHRLESAIISGDGNTLTLRNRSSTVPTTVTVCSGTAEATITMTLNDSIQTLPLTGLQKIFIMDTELTVIYEDGSSNGDSHNGGAAVGNTAALKEENERLKKKLQEASGIMNGLKNAVNELKAENTRLLRDNQGLQQAVEAGVDRILEANRSGQLTISQDLRNKLDSLDLELENSNQQLTQLQAQERDANQKVIEAQRLLNEARERLKGLREQISSLSAQKEVTDLDCEAAAEELEALRTRLQMDGDIVALTESRWLKNNSVTETMKEMKKKIDAVEKRIGFILKARETYGSIVQSAVLRDGDGTITAQEESGVDPRSDSPSTEEPDEET